MITLCLGVHIGYAQTCCSGGVPLSGNLGMPLSEAKVLQFSLSYDFNNLNTLKDGRRDLSDQTRQRITHSTLLQVGYALTKKWSIEGLISHVIQERKLSPLNQPETVSKTNGLGDAVLLLKYRFFRDYRIGLGIKMPLGSTTETDERGIVYNADLQSGSGSWDLIYWISLVEKMKIRPSISYSLEATYRATGKNNDYFGSQVYEFGNEAQAIFSVSDQILVFKSIFRPGIGLKWRKVSGDRVDEFDVPSTGGQWLFIRPGLSYIHNDKLSMSIVMDLPLIADLEGTQVTPTNRMNFAIFYKITPKNNKS